MATRSYEIQRFAGGRWVLDSVSDDKEVAVTMAKALMEGSRTPTGVRVMSCQYNDDGTFSEFTVFRATPVDEHNAEAQTRRLKTEEEAKTAREQRGRRRNNRAEPPKKKRRFQEVMVALQLAFGIGITLTAIQMLRLALR